MLEFNIINGRNSDARAGLYCMWIRANEGEHAPLVSVWIDPSMAAFDPQARGNEPDLVVTRSESQSTFSFEAEK